MYQIKIYNSISEVKKEIWDSLTQENVFMCYEYLITFEETTTLPLEPYYITVNNKKKLIAASVCFFENKTKNFRTIDDILLGRLHKFKLFRNVSFLPALICNFQKGHGTHFLFSPELSEEDISALENEMITTIEQIAESHRASICFLSVMESQTNLMEKLEKRGYYKTRGLPSNYIDIKWSSFGEYRNYLGNKYTNMKKSISRHINKNKRAGVVIEQLDNPKGNEPRLFELLEMNHRKYNVNTKFWIKPNYFKKVKENFGKNSILYVAIKQGNLIGVDIELRKGNEALFSYIGVDHGLSKDDLTFFNLAYYEPIKNAIKDGLKRVYYGYGLYATKVKRGCTTEEMFIFYKPGNKSMNSIVKLWFAFHKRWMNHKLSYIKQL